MPSAERVNWAKFRVLVVFLVAMVVLGTQAYLLLGGAALFEPKVDIYVYMPDATGLEVGSPVQVDGVSLGKVTAVELSGASQHDRAVRVTMTARRERLATVPADSFAQISSSNIVGDKFVDVTSGKSPQRLQPGGELAFKSAPELLKSLDVTQFTQQLRLVDATLTDLEEGRTPFGQFVQGSEFYNDLLRRLREIQSAIRDAVSPTSTAGSLLSTDRLHRKVADFLIDLDQQLAAIQSGQGDLGRLLRGSGPYDQTLADVQSLRRTIADLGRSEFFQSDEAYAAWNRKVAGWIQGVDEFNASPAVLTSSVYDNLNGAAQEMRDSLRDFRRNPRKFLRLKLF